MREGLFPGFHQRSVGKASDKDTLIIPILNVYGIGPRIGQLVPHVTVLDGCIYIVGFVSGPGEITQMGKIFRLVFGARPQQGVAPERLETIADVLRKQGSKPIFRMISIATPSSMVIHLGYGLHRCLP